MRCIVLDVQISNFISSAKFKAYFKGNCNKLFSQF